MKFSHLTIFMIFSLCQMEFVKFKVLTKEGYKVDDFSTS